MHGLSELSYAGWFQDVNVFQDRANINDPSLGVGLGVKSITPVNKRKALHVHVSIRSTCLKLSSSKTTFIGRPSAKPFFSK